MDDLFGGEALLDSHLPMLDLIDMLVRDSEHAERIGEPGEARIGGVHDFTGITGRAN